jgi:hypothetical protein
LTDGKEGNSKSHYACILELLDFYVNDRDNRRTIDVTSPFATELRMHKEA